MTHYAVMMTLTWLKIHHYAAKMTSVMNGSTWEQNHSSSNYSFTKTILFILVLKQSSLPPTMQPSTSCWRNVLNHYIMHMNKARLRSKTKAGGLYQVATKTLWWKQKVHETHAGNVGKKWIFDWSLITVIMFCPE